MLETPRCAGSEKPPFISGRQSWTGQSEEAYNYVGQCPQTGETLRLPRTPEIEAIARNLMAELAQNQDFAREGKMYGVLLVADAQGQRRVLKAFSGLLNQQAQVDGWVPPIPGRAGVALAEQETLRQLDRIRDQLRVLQADYQTQQTQYQCLVQSYESQWQVFTHGHNQAKQARQAQRQALQASLEGYPGTVIIPDPTAELERLDRWSRQAGLERRAFKRDRNAVLQPLQHRLQVLETQIQTLKQSRKALSRQLQAQMHQSYWLSNVAGISAPLPQIYAGGMPTGTGDCCAPKLLHFAATQGWTPLALAEFWWGAAHGDKQPGEFYPACRDRCQPLMGFLLSGLSDRLPAWNHGDLAIVYEDAEMVAVEKPPGLLSVPGRSCADCVLWRLQRQLQLREPLWAVHRLDQDTSGLLLLAKNRDTYRHLSHQFQTRQVTKLYSAILAGNLQRLSGLIDLPLWADPHHRPRQAVNWQQGKPSQTEFQVIGAAGATGEWTRILLKPLTGRTHQLRVHAADPQGLGFPIVGDRIYGESVTTLINTDIHGERGAFGPDRLYLHAQSLQLHHPYTGEELNWVVPPAF